MVVDDGKSGRLSKALVVDIGKVVVGGWREVVDEEGTISVKNMTH